MNILALSTDERVKNVSFTEDRSAFDLMDSRTLSAPLVRCPKLYHATTEQLANWQISFNPTYPADPEIVQRFIGEAVISPDIHHHVLMGNGHRLGQLLGNRDTIQPEIVIQRVHLESVGAVRHLKIGSAGYIGGAVIIPYGLLLDHRARPWLASRRREIGKLSPELELNLGPTKSPLETKTGTQRIR